MKIIIGLGNIGKQYENTRHNIGFITIDEILRRVNLMRERTGLQSIIYDASYKGEKILLAKPTTYMNLSGQAVVALMRYYKVPAEDVLIISDDIDLPLGKIRLRPFGGAGTHNGWRSIIKESGTDRFARIRIGVGAPPDNWELADWVLSSFSKDDNKSISLSTEKAAQAALCFIEEGIDKAMNKFNGGQ
ncbi:MAG: aminoacyl-tRNA hydrolase [Eubacteriales bacterium]|nr:aminoacyl-tRNA hydrolase [Eubacteriales bacterium]